MDEAWGRVPMIAANQVRLRDVLKPRKTVIDYLYDIGDSWEHRLAVTRVRAGEAGVFYPRHIAGEQMARLRIAASWPGGIEEVVLDFEGLIQGLLGVHSRYDLHTRAVINS